MSWKNKYRVVGMKPATIVWQGMKLNLRSSRTSTGRIKKAYELGCPFLELINNPAKVKPIHISQVVVPESPTPNPSLNVSKTAQERMLAKAIELDVVSKIGPFIYYDGKRYGCKKILDNVEILLAIENEMNNDSISGSGS